MVTHRNYNEVDLLKAILRLATVPFGLHLLDCYINT